jgi:hypothetical protein
MIGWCFVLWDRQLGRQKPALPSTPRGTLLRLGLLTQDRFDPLSITFTDRFGREVLLHECPAGFCPLLTQPFILKDRLHLLNCTRMPWLCPTLAWHDKDIVVVI